MVQHIKETFAVMVAILVLSGCSSLPWSAESAASNEIDWLSSHGAPIPLEANELKPSAYVEVGGSELSKAIELLRHSKVVGLEGDIELFSSARNRLVGRRFFLLRAKKDDIEGSYSVFLANGQALVLYSHLGGCGDETKSALVVASEAPIVQVFGGCSSGM